MKRTAGKGLGRGLDALLPEEELPEAGSVLEIQLEEIKPNKNQPRRDFDEEKLEALTSSIKEHGVIQPIVVTKTIFGYEIVAGERRFRAAKRAGLKTIPAVVRDYSAAQSAEIALVENLQREDLNPIEEGEGYMSLIRDFDMTQEMVSAAVGKSRSAVANAVRILSLPPAVKKMVEERTITGGHAKAILSVSGAKERTEFAEYIVSHRLSVRQAESLSRVWGKRYEEKPEHPKSDREVELEAIGRRLSERFGTKVHFSGGEKKGKIEIEYYGSDDLERILSLISE